MPAIGRYRRSILFLYLAAVLAATLTPISMQAGGMEDLDKVAHAILFAVLAVLFYWNASAPRRLGSVLISALLSTAFAGVVELLQIRVPARTGDLSDFAVGALGAAVAAVAAHALVGRRAGLGSRRYEGELDGS